MSTKELNQAVLNVAALACELSECLRLAKKTSGGADTTAAVVLVTQAREKLHAAVDALQHLHSESFGVWFSERCAWTFEMPEYVSRAIARDIGGDSQKGPPSHA